MTGSVRSRRLSAISMVAILAGVGACKVQRIDRGADDPVGSAADTMAADEAGGLGGWTLLSDGTLEAWRGYRRDDATGGWSANGDTISFLPGTEGGTLISRDRYADFELVFEWRISEGGNSGVFYRVLETEPAPYWSGPEYQILDNGGHPDGSAPETSAGANFALHGPGEDLTRPVGEWNYSRILVHGALVEHWLNGALVVAYELGSDEWQAAVAASKFAGWPAYGIGSTGHIGLQDHGDPVWYRNVRIRRRHRTAAVQSA